LLALKAAAPTKPIITKPIIYEKKGRKTYAIIVSIIKTNKRNIKDLTTFLTITNNSSSLLYALCALPLVVALHKLKGNNIKLNLRKS
jgi:hypothetical protein